MTPRTICSLSAIFVLFALLLPREGAAAGWLQKRGACYAKLHDRMLLGKKAYSAEGLRDLQDVPTYHDHLLNAYLECGLGEWVTLTASMAPIGYATAQEDTLYVGPMALGARVGLKRQDRLRLAASVALGLDPGVGDRVISRSDFTSEKGEHRVAIYQPTVDNPFAKLVLEAGVGFGLGSIPAFKSAYAGVQLNGGDGIDHALIAGLSLGAMFFSSALVTELHFNLYEPFGASIEQTNTAGAGQTRYLGFGLSLSYWFSRHLGAFATLDGVFFAESNAGTPAISFGLETRFSL